MDSLKWSFPVAAKRQRRLLSYQAHQVNLGPSLSLYPSRQPYQIVFALSRFLALLLFSVGRVTLCRSNEPELGTGGVSSFESGGPRFHSNKNKTRDKERSYQYD